MPPVSPDCRDANHHKCWNKAWDEEADAMVDCTCFCHQPEAAAA